MTKNELKERAKWRDDLIEQLKNAGKIIIRDDCTLDCVAYMDTDSGRIRHIRRKKDEKT